MVDILPIIMNTSFKRLAAVDDYTSLIWTPRYNKVGDFELCVPANTKNMQLIQKGFYVVRDDDENVGIVENIKYQHMEDNYDIAIISGRFLAGLLARRIIAEQTNVSGKISECIDALIDQNVINPTMTARQISNFTLGTYDISTTMQAQYTGKNLLDIISEICVTYGVGFKVILNDYGQFVFYLYEGVDRTYNQTANPWVVFSDQYDNLLSSEYEENYQNIATDVLVAGEGEGLNRITAWSSDVFDPVGSNLLNTDNVTANSLSSFNYSDGVYSGTTTTVNGGLQIKTRDFLTVGTTIIMKFKLQKTAGTLNNIAGYNQAFTQLLFTVDGQDAGSYQDGYSLPNNTEVHEVVYVGKYINTSAQYLNLYIQPNRANTVSLSFQIWDLEMYVTQGVSGIDRYEVYKDQKNIRSNEGAINAVTYDQLLMEAGKEDLTKYTKAFTGTVYFGNIKYKQDVNLGDICVIENSQWGIYIYCRLLEVIESVNEAGEYNIIPTFGL